MVYTPRTIAWLYREHREIRHTRKVHGRSWRGGRGTGKRERRGFDGSITVGDGRACVDLPWRGGEAGGIDPHRLATEWPWAHNAPHTRDTHSGVHTPDS